MKTITNEFLAQLLAEQSGPCLSLYQTTHRSHPENTQDPIRFKNLVKTLEDSLKKAKVDNAEALLAPFHALADDSQFWQQSLDGLVVLSAASGHHILRLQRTVPDFAVVSDTWHVKPLLRITQTADYFHVLCLNRETVRLYEGNRYALDPVTLADDVPATITEALGDQFTEPYQKVSSYGLGPAGGPGSDMRHGHGDKADAVSVDTVRFFRLVEAGIRDKHSTPSGLPLVLVALPEYQGTFRKLSSNSQLLPKGVDIDPGSLNLDQLRDRSWEIVKPVFDERTRTLIERYQQAHGTGLASDDLNAIAKAAFEGRIDTLLVDAEIRIPGTLDADTQSIRFEEDFSDPSVEDVLDDIAELALKTKSKVQVIPSEIMPSKTGLAALYRY